MFNDMKQKEVEVYINDMIAKSRTSRDHLVDLRKLFEHHVKYRLGLNPYKYVFGASLGKLLGFVVSQAIRDMPTL